VTILGRSALIESSGSADVGLDNKLAMRIRLRHQENQFPGQLFASRLWSWLRTC